MVNYYTFIQRTKSHIVKTIISKDNFSDDEIIKSINKYLALTPFYVRYLVILSILYVTGLSVIKKRSLFYNLSIQESGIILNNMEHSRLFFNRAIVMMVKLISTLVYFDHDENARAIGYEHLTHCK